MQLLFEALFQTLLRGLALVQAKAAEGASPIFWARVRWRERGALALPPAKNHVLYQVSTLEAAEKLGFVSGHDFSRAVNT
jgi:hypothetical protein